MFKSVVFKKILTNISTSEIFDLLKNEEFYCLSYSPDFCGFSRPDKISDVFEFRCFNENFELRFVKNAPESGDAVIISENQKIGDFILDESSEDFYKLERKYLLWGTTRKIDGKTFLFEHRIGEFEIPLNVETGKKIFLSFDEFFSLDQKHGNMLWRFERLKGVRS